MARVIFLGRFADAVGWRERSIEANTLSSLKARIVAEEPAVGGTLDGAHIVVVNDGVICGDAEISEKDEAAFLPPMSGGLSMVILKERAFDPGEMLATLKAAHRPLGRACNREL